MKKREKNYLDAETVYDLCRRNQWLISATIDQCDNIFDLSRKGATVCELARVISIYTPGWSIETIKEELTLESRSNKKRWRAYKRQSIRSEKHKRDDGLTASMVLAICACLLGIVGLVFSLLAYVLHL